MATVTTTVRVAVSVEEWALEYGMEADVLKVQRDAESYLRTLVQECSAGQAGLITIEEG